MLPVKSHRDQDVIDLNRMVRILSVPFLQAKLVFARITIVYIFFQSTQKQANIQAIMIKHMNEHILHGSKLEIPSTSSFLPAKCACNLQVFDAISIQQTRRTETSKAYFTVDRAVVSTLSLPFTSHKSERLYKTSLSDFADAVTTPQIRLDVLKESFICKQNRQKLGIPNAFKVQSSFRISEKHQVY